MEHLNVQIVAAAERSLTVALAGELDAATSPRLTSIVRTIATDLEAIAFDLSHLEFIDSLGLRAFLRLRTERPELRISLHAARPNVQRVFTMTGADRLFELCPPPPAPVEAQCDSHEPRFHRAQLALG